MSNYKPGTWRGTVKDYGIGETQAGDPQVFVQFSVEFPDGAADMTWYGSLKEGKAREITLNALLNLGFKGKDVTDLLDGPDGAAIPLGIDALLVVEPNEYNGKTTMRINWVNRPGGGGAVKRADANTAKAKLLKLGLAGELARLKATTPPRQVDDVPF